MDINDYELYIEYYVPSPKSKKGKKTLKEDTFDLDNLVFHSAENPNQDIDSIVLGTRPKFKEGLQYIDLGRIFKGSALWPSPEYITINFGTIPSIIDVIPVGDQTLVETISDNGGRLTLGKNTKFTYRINTKSGGPKPYIDIGLRIKS